MASKAQGKLVVFDVEGVLIPKFRFIIFEVAGTIGTWPFVKATFLGLLYETGLISLKTALKNLYRLFKGLSLEKFISLFQEVPLMPEVDRIFKELKRYGFKIALISSGIPTVALEKLRESLGADNISGLEIGLSNSRLTGEIWGDVIEPKGKATALKRILADKDLSRWYRVGVADDRNNLSMFQLCNLKIGYNPDFILTCKSDYVVKGDLSKVIPIITGKQIESSSNHTDLARGSIMREAIHTGGFLVPLACAYLASRHLIASFIFMVTVLYAVSETGRMFGVNVPVIKDVTIRAAGESEFQGFVASPIFYALGIIMSLLLFPVPAGYVSVTVLTLGDGAAAICGQKFGRRRVPFNKAKNLEGTLCGLLFAFLGSLRFVDPLRASISSVVGMFVEVLPLPVNDNLAIPLASGLALVLTSALLHF